MTDPFSITTGVVGVTAIALHSLKAPLRDISAIQDAPALIKALQQDLGAVDTILESLKATSDDNRLTESNKTIFPSPLRSRSG